MADIQDVQERVTKFQEFLDINYKAKIHEVIGSGSKSLIIDFRDFLKFDHEIADYLLSNPEDTLKELSLAIEQFDLQQSAAIQVRFSNLPQSQKIKVRDIRSDHLNKFIAVEGIVRQASDVRPQVISATFECPSCGQHMRIPQIEQHFREPYRCSCGKKGRGFKIIKRDLVDTQRLVLEESPESLQGGEQPKRLSVFLREDLVDPRMEKRTTPGAKILVNAVVKEIAIQLKSGAQSTRYDLAAEANNIEPIEETYEEIEISKEDEAKIKQLAKDPKVYEKFVSSIAVSIFGHENIKGALVLQLMGGVKKERSDGTATKGDIHILLVGDPGSAKTSLLMFMSKVAPKSRYVAGKSASAAGITATVVKDEFLRGWALEAGAIVLANGGFLFLDELDKMSQEDSSALHEALAQQRVTISKANIQATLKAQTTVLAAANPKFGRFDPYQPIAQQIDLPPALINRFDLIFPVRDLPSKDKDTKIASHILELQQRTDDLQPEIALALIKKYVAYARKNIFPKLTTDAVEELRDFYVGLRNMPTIGEQGGVKPIPISARQLEALVRLAEASARVRLSDKVTRADARNAINILRHCLMQVGFDYETGQMDIDRISTGIPASTRSKIIIIREIINNMDSKGKKTIPIIDIVSEALEKNIKEVHVEEVIERLKREGEIFEPRRGWIAKV